MRTRRPLLPLAVGLALLVAGPVRAFDAAPHADEEVIEVVTTNEDGTARTTKIWIVVVGGDAYVRTGKTGWGQNLERDPDLRVLTATGAYDLRVEFVTDEAARAPVVEAFRAKYGWPDRLMSPLRGRHPKIMRLVERTGGG